MKRQALLRLALSSLAVPLLLGQVSLNGDGNWPREVDTGSIQLVIYQPQVDSWKDNLIDQGEFTNRKQSLGIPRTVAPPRMTAPARPSAPGHR
jgi:hypothetical protein